MNAALQSDLELVRQQVKSLEEEGMALLFNGTPTAIELQRAARCFQLASVRATYLEQRFRGMDRPVNSRG